MVNFNTRVLPLWICAISLPSSISTIEVYACERRKPLEFEIAVEEDENAAILTCHLKNAGGNDLLCGDNWLVTWTIKGESKLPEQNRATEASATTKTIYLSGGSGVTILDREKYDLLRPSECLSKTFPIPVDTKYDTLQIEVRLWISTLHIQGQSFTSKRTSMHVRQQIR